MNDFSSGGFVAVVELLQADPATIKIVATSPKKPNPKPRLQPLVMA